MGLHRPGRDRDHLCGAGDDLAVGGGPALRDRRRGNVGRAELLGRSVASGAPYMHDLIPVLFGLLASSSAFAQEPVKPEPKPRGSWVVRMLICSEAAVEACSEKFKDDKVG